MLYYAGNVGEGIKIYWDKYFNEAITDGRRIKKLCKTFKKIRGKNPNIRFVVRTEYKK